MRHLHLSLPCSLTAPPPSASHSATLQACTVCLSSFTCDPSSEPDRTAVLHGLQLAAMVPLQSVCHHNAAHQAVLVEDLCAQLLRLPTGRRSLRAFVVNAPADLSASAQVMRPDTGLGVAPALLPNASALGSVMCSAGTGASAPVLTSALHTRRTSAAPSQRQHRVMMVTALIVQLVHAAVGPVRPAVSAAADKSEDAPASGLQAAAQLAGRFWHFVLERCGKDECVAQLANGQRRAVHLT